MGLLGPASESGRGLLRWEERVGLLGPAPESGRGLLRWEDRLLEGLTRVVCVDRLRSLVCRGGPAGDRPRVRGGDVYVLSPGGAAFITLEGAGSS